LSATTANKLAEYNHLSLNRQLDDAVQAG
jgi:hypothetical protein